MTSRTRKIGTAAMGLVAIASAQACGGKHDVDSQQPSEADVIAYRQLALKTESTAAAYGSTMMGPSMTATMCGSLLDRYDGEVRPWVSQMVQMASRMDDFMAARGGSTVADYGCVAATMMNELDYHRSVACTFADLAPMQAEASRHVDAMTSYAGHMWDRCSEAMDAFSEGRPDWAPMMQGCQTWDGYCSGMMHGCCSGMMHDACE